MKQTFLKTALLFLIAIVFSNCDKEEIIIEQQKTIETVSVTEALNLFNNKYSKTSSKTTSKSNNTPFAFPILNFISQEEITDSEESLTIIPAYTAYNNVYSRILLLKIEGTIESVVFSMVRDENSSTEQFSGKLYITDLDGNYINAFRVVDDVLVSRFLKPTSTGSKSSKNQFSKNNGEDDCWGIACGMEGEEVLIIANPSKPSSINYIELWALYNNAGGGSITNTWDPISGGGSTGCSDGYIKDGNGNCVAPVVVVAPDDPITDMEKFLNYFDTTHNAELTIYADQPVNNSSVPISSSGDPGHAFVSITQNGNTVSFGFYPKQKAKAFGAADGAIGNNQNHEYDASVTINISGSILSEILNFANTIPANYNINIYNCTDYVIDISNFTGLNLPDCFAFYPGVGNGGSSPSVLGQYIRNLPESDNYSTSTTTANGPNQSGNCNN